MRRFFPFLLLLAVALSAIPAQTRAQVSRADSADVVLQTARSFQANGRWEVAEALFEYITERWGDTPAGSAALEALRTPAEQGASQSSQVELQVWSTLYGAFLGVAIPAAFGANSSAPYGVGLLVGGPGGFLAGRTLGKSRSLSEGQVRAITFGGTWGSWQGYGWTQALNLGQNEVCHEDFCYTNDPDGETIMKGMVVGSLAGIATGALVARSPIPRGVATSATFGALWGSWFGVTTGVLADLEGNGLLATTLLSGNAGILAGGALGSRWELSRNRARLISIAGVLGGVGGAGLDLLLKPEDEKVAIGIPLATSLAGLTLGTILTADDRWRPGAAAGAGAESGPDQDLGLLQFRNGRFGPGIPAPFVTALPVETPVGRTTWRPGVGVNLFSARF